MTECDITLHALILAQVDGVLLDGAGSNDVLCQRSPVLTIGAYIYCKYLGCIAGILTCCVERQVASEGYLGSDQPVVGIEGNANIASRSSALGAIETDAVTGIIISGSNGIPNEPVVGVTIGIDCGPTLGQSVVLASLKVLEEASCLGLLGVNAVAQGPFAVILVGPHH